MPARAFSVRDGAISARRWKCFSAGLGVLHVAERNPAGEELALDGLVAILEAMGRGDLVGGLGAARSY